MLSVVLCYVSVIVREVLVFDSLVLKLKKREFPEY